MRLYDTRREPYPHRDWEEGIWEKEDWEADDWEEDDWEEERPAPRAAGRRRRRVRRRSGLGCTLALLLAVCVTLVLILGRLLLPGGQAPGEGTAGQQPSDLADAGAGDGWPDTEDWSQTDEQKLQEILEHPEQYPQALRELAEKNPEALDYVYQYPQLCAQTPEIDLSAEAASGQVPLLLQWDSRWGYRSYGSGLIGYTGCGPTCLSMVALFLTGNPAWDPATVANYAETQGYYVEGTGTAWDLMSDGCAHFGLAAEELPLDEGRMAAALEAGMPLICAMGPGDFTDYGHFIVVAGYDGTDFSIRDPNSPQRSAQGWSFDRLSGQIRNIWAFSHRA